MVETNLSILLVVIPLLAAPVTALLPSGRLPWVITFIVTLLCLWISFNILVDVTQGNLIHYELGGWAPPWGIAYEIDALNALVAFMVSLVGTLVTIYARYSVSADIPAEKHALFYASFLLCFLGLLGMTLTGDIFNVFVFLEISSLSTYALVSMGRNREALSASFQYLILGTIGATFFLIGIGLAYAATGSLNMADLATRLAESRHSRTIETALAFIFVGMALKAAMFPLHQWLPRAYTYAPMMVTTFLAGTATKVAIYVIARTTFSVFTAPYAATTIFNELMVILGAMAVIYGAIQAIRQTGFKPLLAWSSLSQIGYFMIGIGLLSATGLMATMVHLFNHAIIKTTLFMAAGILLYQTGTLRISRLRGIGKHMPLTFTAIVIAGLSLIGVPGTVGFISKWYLVQAAVEQQLWWLAAVVVLGSVLAIGYVWKIVETLYFQPQDEPMEISGDKQERRLPLVVPVWILAVACIYLGIDTDITVGAAQSAARTLGLIP
ncbi:MAG: monovalent cation/H+ antiporter subunit D family protein [Gammaproteobacteria bacterium]|nr:MAG: monovalent cation/H+ antiporter subunit D family protein [Gammaproteobacteria bacterium]